MARQKTHEEFIEDIKYYYGNLFTVLSKFINSKSKIELRCNVCNEEFPLAQAGKLINPGRSCPNCGKLKIESVEDIKKYQKEFYNNEYKIKKVKTPISNDSSILVLHKTCGEEFTTTIDDFFNKKKICSTCKGDRTKVTIDDFKKYVYEKENGDYTVLSDRIVNVMTHVMMRHNVCGHEYPVSPNHFKNGKRCPKCAKKIIDSKKYLSQEEAFKRVMDCLGDEYRIISDTYISVHEKIKVEHITCGTKWDIKPINIFNGNGCPTCKASKGEREIIKILKAKNIPFVHQKKLSDIKDIKSIRRMKYDIFIPKYNLAIEYNGIQHYKPVEVFGGQDEFKKIKRRDKIKKVFSEKYGVTLKVIAYNHKNTLEEIIDKILIDAAISSNTN